MGMAPVRKSLNSLIAYSVGTDYCRDYCALPGRNREAKLTCNLQRLGCFFVIIRELNDPILVTSLSLETS
jgi:hypothetical protein